MSIRPESTDRTQANTEAEAFFEQVYAEPSRLVNVREAAHGPWVIVPAGFVPPKDPYNHPVEVVQVSFDIDEDHSVPCFVLASIIDDPELFDRFCSEGTISNLQADVHETYAKLNLKDLRPLGIYTVDEMENALEKMETNCSYLLQDLIPRQSVNIMVGDSGIGKSPFGYELGICIAAGLPFLGIPTTQGRVLYLDYEDDVAGMISYARTISKKIGLSKPPDTFRFWSPAMADDPNQDPFQLIREFRPDFVIIDTISTAFPEAETENRIATTLYKECRDTGAAVLFTHHLKKDSPTEDSSFDLDLDRETTVRDFLDVRGAGALVNTAYLRLKLIRVRSNDEDWAFIVRGYRRGKGGLPTLSVGRVLDENGAPIGHYRLGGLARLNENHRKVFESLSEEFQWKHLAEYFKGNGSKQVFIRACIAAKLLNPEKDGDCYRKLPGWKTV